MSMSGDQGHLRRAGHGPVGRGGHRGAHHAAAGGPAALPGADGRHLAGCRPPQDYQAGSSKWDTAAADLAAVLGQIGVALGAANDSYQQAEQANAARWR